MTTKKSDLEMVHFQGTTDALNDLSIWKQTTPTTEKMIQPREIEFRFWDAWNEVMIYSEGLKLSKFFEMFEKLQEGENNPVLMRFTGKTDKNGNKIFEGDRLEHNGSFSTVIWDDEMAAYGLKSEGSEAIDFDFCTYAPISTIIGNIHENEGK